jgi:hypothetical protein
MKPCLTAPLLSALFFLSVLNASGQTSPTTKVNVDFTNADINTIVTYLEKQADVQFYFDPAQFDSVSFSAKAQQISLTQVLDKIFANSDYKYVVYKSKYIILTKGDQIYTSFKSYSEKKQQESNTRKSDSVQLASNENKLYVIGIPGTANPAKSFILTGYVRDEKTGESIVGVSIQIDKPLRRAVTNDYGYYTIEVPAGKHLLRVESLGMNDRNISISMNDNGKLDFELAGRVTTLKSVVISREKLNNVRNAQMGAQRIDIKTIKQVPVVLGETDVLKVVTTLPGVKTIGEASTGLNVRGGSSDQNLLMYNDATIYNPAHFFGMFSAFNPDVVKDVVLYKSSMPARYGGRLSSVVDISGKEGNKKQLSGSTGFGPLTGRIVLEGPIVKDRSSFIAGVRSTYAQWLINKLPKEYRNSNASFYDINFLFSQSINKNNDVYLMAYASSDKFKLNNDTSYGYRNLNFAMKWKHVFSNKLNVVVTSGWDNYKYEVNSSRHPVNAFNMKFDIQQANFKTHFTRYINSGHTIDFGVQGILYQLNPGTYEPANGGSLVAYDKLQGERGLESAIYVNDSWSIGDLTAIEAGIRYSMFNAMGPRDVNTYAKDLPRSDESVTGTVSYNRGKIVKSYGGPEYRVSLRQSISANSSIKIGVNTQRQYIHMLSNTAAMTPTDTWKLSDPNIKPQSGTQYSIGYYTNLKSNTIEISIESYFKQIRNYLDYKSGAILTMNHHIETDVINTKGKAYGAELMIKKSTGKLNGWISYTWSRILLQQNDPVAGELINDGKEYPANYDKPHDFTFIGNFRVNHRLSISLNSTYSTGRPITLPVGRFYYSNSFRTVYGPRNAYRIPDYFRIDLSMNLEGSHNLTKKLHTSCTFGIYNLTARKNPFSVYYVSENGVINGYKLSVFGTAIPFISFNTRF